MGIELDKNFNKKIYLFDLNYMIVLKAFLINTVNSKEGIIFWL